GDELQATGGGRVTELAARPILNLFFPELSGIVQPLSGEQAGRRTLLEQLPFFSGYGVETGLLVDTLQRAGLSAIGQVDMKQRIHRNQSLYDLSKMSFEVLQVAIKRVGEAHGTNLLEEANFTMKLIAAGGGKLHLEMHDIIDIERPVRDHDLAVVSIFVNPTQFGPHEDFAAYPRDESADIAACERLGAAMVFAPAALEMYPPGDATRVQPGAIAERLEGAARPG